MPKIFLLKNRLHQQQLKLQQQHQLNNKSPILGASPLDCNEPLSLTIGKNTCKFYLKNVLIFGKNSFINYLYCFKYILIPFQPAHIFISL